MKESVHQLTEGPVMTGTSPLPSDHVLRRKMIVPDLAGLRETEHLELVHGIVWLYVLCTGLSLIAREIIFRS